MIEIGPYRVETLMAGRFALDGGAMFGVVPRTLWQRKIPPDDLHRIPLALRCLLLRGADRIALVDTGIGATKWGDKERRIYGIDHTTHELLRALALREVRPEDVTDVILTHLHFDHAGGATVRRGAAVVPTFPRATYYVQRRNLAWARAPTPRDRASYLARDFEPLARAGQLLVVDDGEALPLPNVEIFVAEGHTEAQQLPIVSDGVTTIAFGGDVVPTSAHVPVPWLMGYDLRPLETMTDKRRLLRRAADEDWIFVYEHDPAVAATRIIETDRGLAAGEPVAI